MSQFGLLIVCLVLVDLYFVYFLCLAFFTDADRGDIQKGSAEIFFRKVKFWKEDGETEAPPVFVGTRRCTLFTFWC